MHSYMLFVRCSSFIILAIISELQIWSPIRVSSAAVSRCFASWEEVEHHPKIIRKFTTPVSCFSQRQRAHLSHPGRNFWDSWLYQCFNLRTLVASDFLSHQTLGSRLDILRRCERWSVADEGWIWTWWFQVPLMKISRTEIVKLLWRLVMSSS